MSALRISGLVVVVALVCGVAWFSLRQPAVSSATEQLPSPPPAVPDAAVADDAAQSAGIASSRASTEPASDGVEAGTTTPASKPPPQAAPELSVEVVWSDGRPAEEADVFLRAVDAESLDGRHAAVTDSSGVAKLAAPATRAVVWARLDELASLPRETRAGARTRLVLSGLVSAEGRLQPNPEIPGVRMRVTCFALDGARRVKLAERFTTVDEPWRMDELPLPDSRQFLFRFESDKTMPIEARRRAERPGDVMNVDMEILAGYVRPVRVEDEEGKGIEGARVVAQYINAFSYPVTFEGVTDAKGDCQLAGVPPREGEMYASKKGYATSYYQYPIHALLPEEQVWTIRMPRAAPIRGRVLSAAGEPVQDFDLMWFPPTSTVSHSRAFRGVADGAFELDEVAVGAVTLLAKSDELGQTAPFAQVLGPEGAENVELRFGAAAVVFGAVVDALDESPVARALVQPWSATATRNFEPVGSVVVTDDQGRFRSERFNVGINRFEVSAPGYAPRFTGVFAEAGKVVDAGVVRLARSQSLEVELIHGPDVIPTESYATGAESSGTRTLPPVAFDAQGRLRFRDVSPGHWRIQLMLYTGPGGEYELTLKPGEDWRLRVDVTQVRPWRIELRERDGSRATRGGVNLTWRQGDVVGRYWRAVGDSPDGLIVVKLPPVSAAFLTVMDSSSRWLLERHVGPAEFEQDPYVITLGESSAEYRVVDNAGRPIPAASISSLTSGDVFRQWSTYRTDVDGRATLPHARDVMIKHETAGLGAYFGLSESDRSDGVYQLELDAVGALEVLVRDGAFAVSGVEVQLGQRGCWMTSPVTDASGVAKSLPLAEGRWDAKFELAGYWPARASVDVKRGTPPLRLEVRRLGDVAFEARSASGAAVQGLSVELESVEFGERASEWLAAQRIEASANELRLDSDGKVELKGLPHGAYRWTVSGAEGVLASGEVVLAPRARTSVEARVP